MIVNQSKTQKMSIFFDILYMPVSPGIRGLVRYLQRETLSNITNYFQSEFTSYNMFFHHVEAFLCLYRNKPRRATCYDSPFKH